MKRALRHSPLGRVLAVLILSALGWTVNMGERRAEEENNEDPFALTPDWSPVVDLVPGQTVENIFLAMVRTDGPEAPCPVEARAPLLLAPLPTPGSWGCTRIVDTGAGAGIWRIDFEGAVGPGYRFETLRDGIRSTVLSYAGPMQVAGGETVTAGRRLASVRISIDPGEPVDLFVQIADPGDLLDADPLLRPEETFDAVRLLQAHGFGAVFGASALLLLVFAGFSRLLDSRPGSSSTSRPPRSP